jgi:hypothetical protein
MKSSCGYAKPFECLRALTPGAVFDAVQAQIQGVSAGKSWPSIEQVGLPPTEPRL